MEAEFSEPPAAVMESEHAEAEPDHLNINRLAEEKANLGNCLIKIHLPSPILAFDSGFRLLQSVTNMSIFQHV